MGTPKEAPRGLSYQARTAGRVGESTASGPSQGRYHKPARESSRRAKLLVAVTPQGVKTSGALVERSGGLSWVRKVDSTRHMLRLPEPSWAVDEEKLLEAQAAGATRVEVHDECGRCWWTPLAHFLSHGKRFNRGHGWQVRLRLSEWSFLPTDSVSKEQLGLFAEVGR